MAFAHILVATDFSSLANHALGTAFDEARLHQARVTMVHVLRHEPYTEIYHLKGSPEDPRRLAADFAGVEPHLQGSSPAHRRDLVEEAHNKLRDLVPPDFSGTCEIEITTGDPAEGIVRMARERGADLVVMGTQGRTGLRHVLMGSVAEKVLRQAPCPVLVVRYQERSA